MKHGYPAYYTLHALESIITVIHAFGHGNSYETLSKEKVKKFYEADLEALYWDDENGKPLSDGIKLNRIKELVGLTETELRSLTRARMVLLSAGNLAGVFTEIVIHSVHQCFRLYNPRRY